MRSTGWSAWWTKTGTIISCTDLNRIGEVRDGIAADRLTAGDTFVRDGYTYHLFSSNKRNDYAVMVEGTDRVRHAVRGSAGHQPAEHQAVSRREV